MIRTPIAVAVVAALAACAPKPVVDNTPENPTAVFETRTSFSGIQGNFPFETTEKRFVRADRLLEVDRDRLVRHRAAVALHDARQR